MHGSGYAYRHGIEALLKDPNIDAVVPILMLVGDAKELAKLEFIPELAAKYPDKPILVTFSGELQHFQMAKAILEPQRIPCYQYMEEAFDVLGVLSRCREARERLAAAGAE